MADHVQASPSGHRAEEVEASGSGHAFRSLGAELDAEGSGALRGSQSRKFSIRGRKGFWRDALRRRLLAGADAVAVLSASLVVTLVFGVDVTIVLCTAVAIPGWVLLAKLHGLYDRDHRSLRHLTVDELAYTVSWATTGTASLVAAMSLAHLHIANASVAIRLWTALLILAPMMRGIARYAWRRITPRERIIIIGAGPLELATRRKFELFADMHALCVASISPTDSSVGLRSAIDQVEGSGGTVDRLVLAIGTTEERLVEQAFSYCRDHEVKLSVVPPRSQLFGPGVRLTHVADLALLEFQTCGPGRSTMLIKRTLDITVSLLALMVLAPLLAAIALLIRLDSRGSAIFRQCRVGFEGKRFELFKFRSMTNDAEKRLYELIPLDALNEPVFKLHADPRVTRIGRVLRRTSLDELPQLFNVLRGDMSLVGPRPEELRLVSEYGPEHRCRLNVKPGITGPMQVYGRGALRLDERLAVERDYVENLSVARDARIMMLTLSAVVRGQGAL